MLSTYAQLRRMARTLYSPLPEAGPKAGATPLAAADPARTLDAWQDQKVGLPPYMFETTGARRALCQPVLAVPSGHSMHARDAEHLGVPHVPNRMLRQAMERLVAGEPDWDEALCPITLDLMTQPVQIASPCLDGDTSTTHVEDHAYELTGIEGWFAACSQIAPTLQGTMPTSPMTRARLRYPIMLVANVPVADMCRGRRGLPPLTEDEQRKLHRACRDASRALNDGTGQARDAFQLIVCILMGGVGLAFGIEIFASRDTRPRSNHDLCPPANNDTGFWRGCIGIEVQGSPQTWAWTPDAVRRGCSSLDLVCRESTTELIEEVCAHAGRMQYEHTFWVPPPPIASGQKLPCRFLLNACNIGKQSYLASPHYCPPFTYQEAAELWPYHIGAFAVLTACTLGAAAVYKFSRRRPRPSELSLV